MTANDPISVTLPARLVLPGADADSEPWQEGSSTLGESKRNEEEKPVPGAWVSGSGHVCDETPGNRAGIASADEPDSSAIPELRTLRPLLHFCDTQGFSPGQPHQDVSYETARSQA